MQILHYLPSETKSEVSAADFHCPKKFMFLITGLKYCKLRLILTLNGISEAERFLLSGGKRDTTGTGTVRIGAFLILWKK